MPSIHYSTFICAKDFQIVFLNPTLGFFGPHPMILLRQRKLARHTHSVYSAFTALAGYYNFAYDLLEGAL